MFDATTTFLDNDASDRLLEPTIIENDPNADLNYFLGPARWMYSADGVTWVLAKEPITNPIYTDVTAAYTAIAASSFQRNHGVVMLW